MGLFDFIKKKPVVPKQHAPATNSFGERYDRLTPEGELPWGWVTKNKDFCDKIKGGFSYFLNMWLDARKKSPKEQYQALKAFVVYLEDVERRCKSEGECFEFWFREILTSKDYVEKRKKELEELTAKLG